MHDFRTDSRSIVSRRRVVTGSLGLVAGGAAAVWTSTDRARAAVDMSGLSIADATYGAPDNQIYSPVIRLDAEWSFTGVESASTASLYLLVDGSIIDSITLSSVASPDDSGTTELQGVVVDATGWMPEDWQPADDSAVSHAVNIEVRYEVKDTTGETLAKDSAATETTIEVYDAGPTYSASIVGEGDVLFQETQGGEIQNATNTSQ